MSSIQEKQQVLIDDFDFIEEWMDKYNHIIEMGKSMTTLSEEEKEEDVVRKRGPRNSSKEYALAWTVENIEEEEVCVRVFVWD